MSSLNIIPKPGQIEIGEGTFTLTPGASITTVPEAEKAARLLIRLTGLKRADNGEVRFIPDNTIDSPEGYRLSVASDGITINASAGAGFFYAVQTLRQLLPDSIETDGMKKDAGIPMLEILDSPRFDYRSYMLDESRHFFGRKQVEKLLDLLALHKINKFHWHLSDDQGFRLAVDNLPRLTEVGSMRKESQKDGGILFQGRRTDGIPHGGYYSAEDIRGIVSYAEERFIEIIPEIDMPGHMTAALAAYPEFSCSGGPHEVRTFWGISEDVLCPGKDEALDFVREILKTVIKLFPSDRIHIGGDECPTKKWKTCPDCRNRMKSEGIKNSSGLQPWFTNKIIEFLQVHGKTAVVWDEAVTEELDSSAVVQYWHPTKGLKRGLSALKEGHRLIVSPFLKYYLDYSFEMIPLKQSYEFDPVPEGLSEELAGAILGVETPLWTEWVDSPERIYWQSFPRATAVAETGWTAQALRDFGDFIQRLSSFNSRLEIMGVRPATTQCYSFTGKPKRLKFLLSGHPEALTEYRRYGACKEGQSQ